MGYDHEMELSKVYNLGQFGMEGTSNLECL